jgi:iron complex transport system substrate-binding protein
MYIAGHDGFFDRLVGRAGGRVVYSGVDIRFPKVSKEGILRMNPNVIIDLVSDLEKKGFTTESVLAQWRELDLLQAVKNHRVHVFGKGYCVVPGPRLHLLLSDLAKVLHPEVDWNF